MVALFSLPFDFHNYPWESFLHALLERGELSLPMPQRRESLWRSLCDFLEKLPAPSFALPALLQIFEALDHPDLFVPALRLDHFESWMNQHLDFASQKRICGKIAGRSLPSSAYQIFFPLKKEKLEGCHVVTAHSSPDLDTAATSFWGWLDAFAARLGTGLHLWNLPGGVLSDPDRPVFTQYFSGIFQRLARTQGNLTFCAFDLISSNLPQTFLSTLPFDSFEPEESGVVLLDAFGYYKGYWCKEERQAVEQALAPMREWFFYLQEALVRQAKEWEKEQQKENRFGPYLQRPLLSFLEDFETHSSRSGRKSSSRKLLELCFEKVLKLSLLPSCSLAQLGPASRAFGCEALESLFGTLSSLKSEECKEALSHAFATLFEAVGSLETALLIKRELLERPEPALFCDAKLEQVQERILSFPTLPVVCSADLGKLLFMGVIERKTLEKSLEQKLLGTLSIRDFSNRDEVTWSDSFDLVSVIDHHKTEIQTSKPSCLTISNTKACSTLLAEMQIRLNDSYRRKGVYFVDPQRERIEYTIYIYAILDDTDLLENADLRDLESLVEMLQRLEPEAQEALSIEELDEDRFSILRQRLLSYPSFSALANRLTAFKEESLRQQISFCQEGKPHRLFYDTKTQKKSARVGQIKLTSPLFALFEQREEPLLSDWLEKSRNLYRKEKKIDLHIQMVSRIKSAQEASQSSTLPNKLLDALWVWSPEEAQEHLHSFVKGFSKELKTLFVEIEILSANESIENLLQVSFSQASFHSTKKTFEKEFLLLFRFPSGILNSRKANITPYL